VKRTVRRGAWRTPRGGKRRTARRGRWTCASVAALVAALISGAFGASAQALRLEARLTPFLPGLPTNFSSAMAFAEGEALPKPVRKLVAYGPAGLRLDVGGIATCARAKLEADGPPGCPAESRVGFGGGVGVVELGETTVREPFTLDFFLAPRKRGRLTILGYASASDPVRVELVFAARETHGPSPYGLGLAATVPAISTVPGAPNVSVQEAFVSLGASDIAYYETVHGRRRLVPVKGLIAPRRCRRGRLHFEAIATFQDGTSSSGSYATRCPRGRR